MKQSIKTIYLHYILYVIFITFMQSWHARTQTVTADLNAIKLPVGFKIQQFASIPGARQIAVSPNGVIYVGSNKVGNVYAIKDTDGNLQADYIKIIASGLNIPNGVAYKNGSLYVAQIHRLIRFDDIENNLQNPTYVVVRDDFPKDEWHGQKFISFGPDGKLYVPIGMPCNVCQKNDPYGTITRMNPDGTQYEVYARGIRNTVGFDWHPSTKNLWFPDNGRDLLGDDIPSDQINMINQSGMNFGFPYCHGGSVLDPTFNTHSCSQFVAPQLNLQAHVAPLGLDFYTGSQFQQKYKNGFFVAQHGSWNRASKVGYKVIFVKFQGNNLKYNQDFGSGWLQGQTVSGRPVDIEQFTDGSILVSGDQEGIIYRISYTGNLSIYQRGFYAVFLAILLGFIMIMI